LLEVRRLRNGNVTLAEYIMNFLRATEMEAVGCRLQHQRTYRWTATGAGRHGALAAVVQLNYQSPCDYIVA